MLEHLHKSINEVLYDGGRPQIKSLTREMDLRRDIGLDSLELAVLTVKLEAELSIDVFADGLVATVGEVEDRLLGQ
ncbi:MAG: acyl carrier protein [Planctomycetales bacterium]|nr:acyl carrier protein [Planctomycetales bacterium]